MARFERRYPSFLVCYPAQVRGSYLIAFITVRIHSYTSERLGVFLRLAKAESRPFEPEHCFERLGKR